MVEAGETEHIVREQVARSELLSASDKVTTAVGKLPATYEIVLPDTMRASLSATSFISAASFQAHARADLSRGHRRGQLRLDFD